MHSVSVMQHKLVGHFFGKSGLFKYANRDLASVTPACINSAATTHTHTHTHSQQIIPNPAASWHGQDVSNTFSHIPLQPVTGSLSTTNV